MSEKVLTEAEIREILESAGWTRTFWSPANVVDYQRSQTPTQKYNRVLIYASDLPRYKITKAKLEKLMAETNLSKHAEILLGLVDPEGPLEMKQPFDMLEKQILDEAIANGIITKPGIQSHSPGYIDYPFGYHIYNYSSAHVYILNLHGALIIYVRET